MAKSSNKTIGLVLLVGGAAYYLSTRQQLAAAAAAPVASNPFTGSLPPTNATPTRTATVLGAAAAVGAAVIPAIIGTTVGAGAAIAAPVVAASATGGAAPVAAGAGIGIGVIGGAAIAAAAAIISWEVAYKGVGRGGEEGVYVNPGRDQYFDYYILNSSYNLDAPYVPVIGQAVPKPRFAGDVQTVRYNAFVEVARKSHVPESEINRLLTKLYAAKTLTMFSAAVKDIQTTFATYA